MPVPEAVFFSNIFSGLPQEDSVETNNMYPSQRKLVISWIWCQLGVSVQFRLRNGQQVLEFLKDPIFPDRVTISECAVRVFRDLNLMDGYVEVGKAQLPSPYVEEAVFFEGELYPPFVMDLIPHIALGESRCQRRLTGPCPELSHGVVDGSIRTYPFILRFSIVQEDFGITDKDPVIVGIAVGAIFRSVYQL